MNDITRQLAALTDEEQAIYRQDWIEPDDRERLKQIERERAHLWNVKRALSAGCDPVLVVPLEGYKVDQPNGWKLNGRNTVRLPMGPKGGAAQFIAEITAYAEEQSHAEP